MAASVRRRARTNGTVQSQPLIAVRDVKASSGWYRQLLNLKSGHGGREYERLLCDGELVMQLHAWNAEEHPNLTDPDAAPPGHGVLLWFETSDFDAAVRRATALGARVLEGPRINANSGLRELWLHDLDGYVVVLASSREHGRLWAVERRELRRRDTGSRARTASRR
ncbi:MAG: glyoxalase/bleomycin resistance/extradiol dioxygenase family protein [Candidatus Rokuibacteriota bacterium]|nr:MAG: glyoxalase/bleomycin resistance/extradiol dioxygenase family protein [Candidatus Rokubacteria bacterium]